MRPCTVGADRAGVEVPGWAARIYRTNVGACLRYWTSLGLLMALTLADEQRRLRRTAPSQTNSAVSAEQRRLRRTAPSQHQPTAVRTGWSGAAGNGLCVLISISKSTLAPHRLRMP